MLTSNIPSKNPRSTAVFSGLATAIATPMKRLKTMIASRPPPVFSGLKAFTASASGFSGMKFRSVVETGWERLPRSMLFSEAPP